MTKRNPQRAGDASFVNEFTANPNQKIRNLTDREIEIIKLLSQGYSTCEISITLSISEYTVSTHRKNSIRKTESKNSAHLVSRCIRLGIV